MDIVISATSIGGNAGPFTITDSLSNTLATGITRSQILSGYTVLGVSNSATSVTLTSSGTCTNATVIPVPGSIFYSVNGTTIESSTTPFCEAIMKNRQLITRRYTITITDSACNPLTIHPNYTFQVRIESVNLGVSFQNITINNGSASNYIVYTSVDACDTNNQETVTINSVPSGLAVCTP